jgi:hypothetical protein
MSATKDRFNSPKYRALKAAVEDAEQAVWEAYQAAYMADGAPAPAAVSAHNAAVDASEKAKLELDRYPDAVELVDTFRKAYPNVAAVWDATPQKSR